MSRRTSRATAALLIAVLALAGCSRAPDPDPVPTPSHLVEGDWDEASGNGLTLLTPAGAREAAIDAMREAGPVRMQAELIDADGVTTRVLVEGSRSRFTAEIGTASGTTSIVVIDREAYLLPSAGLAAAHGLPREVHTCLSVDDPLVAGWGSLLYPMRLVAELAQDASMLAAAQEETVDVVLGAEATEGVLTLRTSGPPLPTALVRADAAGTLTVRFGDWGLDADVAVPEALAPGC